VPPQKDQRAERRLAAIFAADVAGYSRLKNQDEAQTLRALAAAREVMDSLIGEHGGRIANTAGDSVLAEFPSAVDAVQCAVAVQEKLAEASAGEAEDRRLLFRIGVHVGDVVIRGGDLLGDGVNIAARLEGLANPGGIAISGAAHGHVRKALPLAYTDLGEQQVKNIDEAVRAYSVSPSPAQAIASTRNLLSASAVVDRPSLAVLPFENLSGNPEQQYFADGITEDLITALTRIRWIHVVARNSVFGYNRKAQDVRQAACDLQATYVLEGSARRETSRVRLTAQLTDGATGTHIWAKRYDRALEDIFAVQDDLTESIFAAVVPELGAAERERARAKRPESLTAWDWYQRGMSHLYRRTKYDVSEAERLFNLALELDNTLVPALCALSEVHYFQTFFGQSSEVAFHRMEAKRLADRAVNLDNQDPGAYCALARANMMSGDHGTASSYAETALALNPASALALYLLGMSHLYDGRANEGLPHIESAIRLSPHDQYAGRFMAAIAEGNLFLGEYEKALEWARRSIRQPRSSLTSRREAALAAALAQLGCIDEARLVVQELLREWPGLTICLLCQPVPPMNREYLDRYVEGLKKAGLPE